MAIDTEETRASTCGFLQAWVLPGMRAGSSGAAWRQVTGHVYGENILQSSGSRLQTGNRYASHILGRHNVNIAGG